MGQWWGISSTRRERAVSNVLGVVLVVSVVFIGVIAIVGFGVTGLAGSTTDLSDTAVERDLVGLATAIDEATVYSQSSPGTTSIDLATSEVAHTSERLRVDETAGTFDLAIRNESGENQLVTTSLGLLEYENPQSDARIAYQSGLVFSAPAAGETPGVIRTNAFDHRVDRGVHGVSIHVTRLTGQELRGQSVEISGTGRESLHRDSVLKEGDELVIRITSSYSESWELALDEIFPDDRTDITTAHPNADEALSAHDADTLVLVYEVPAEGAFLDAFLHEVALAD